jgi:aspartate-semialdehyde dehydrogenase
VTRESPLPSAVLGAGGYIGQHFVRLLADHPLFGPPRLVAGPKSAGKTLADVWQLEEPPPAELAETRLVRLSPAGLARSGVRVAFGAIPSGTAGPLETECRRRGLAVFSNAADHRMDRDVPLLVPEANGVVLERLRARGSDRGLLVTNPNCTTAGLVLALKPVWELLGPKTVHVASYQALSGAGFPGVPSLSIADNVVPFIREEEEKVEREARRILRPDPGSGAADLVTPFVVHCARVSVREGHLEAVTVEAGARPRQQALADAWRSFDPLADRYLPTAPHPPISLRAEEDRPQPLRDRWAGSPTRARGMAVTIGRVRWTPPYLRFFALVHNAVRGGAGGSVLNAELAESYGLLDGARREVGS